MRRELARSFGATLVVILTIVITSFLIRSIGQAARGNVSPQDVVLLLGYTALNHLATMLSLSLFVAIVITLGRMYRESEMAIWFASGVGLARFVKPVLRTSAPVLLVTAALLVFVWPWSNRSSLELRDRYQQRSDLSRVTPGVFQVSGDGRRVFFIERESPDGVNARNVFVLAQTPHGESVTTARGGRLETSPRTGTASPPAPRGASSSPPAPDPPESDGGDRYLVLERGQRNEVDERQGTRTQASFESYRVLVQERAAREAQARPPRAQQTIDLVRDPQPRNQAELAWRFGMLLATANLLLLGIGFAATNPRRPYNWNLLFALLSFFVYFNLINLSQAWVAGGRIGLGGALAGVHGAVFVLGIALLWWRDHAAVVRWPRGRAASVAG